MLEHKTCRSPSQQPFAVECAYYDCPSVSNVAFKLYTEAATRGQAAKFLPFSWTNMPSHRRQHIFPLTSVESSCWAEVTQLLTTTTQGPLAAPSVQLPLVM